MKTVTDAKDVEAAWNLQYSKLASRFSSFIPSEKALLLEIGSGTGQLTIPLARQTSNLRILAVDSYRRPYSPKDYGKIVSVLERKGLKRRVSVVVSDYSHWLSQQPTNKFDGVISSEFFPEIDSGELKQFLSECWRVTKPRGVTAHSFLSPVARNRRQGLLIEADSDPRWTKDPPKQWFSPDPNFVADQLRRAGFHRVKAVSVESRLVFRAEAARTLLRDWGVRNAFWNKRQRYLQQEGLGVPDWAVITGLKPGQLKAR